MKRLAWAAAALLFAAVLVLAPSAYDLYRERKAHTEALGSAERVRERISRFHADHKRLPAAHEAAPFRLERDLRAKRIDYDAERKMIVITMQGTAQRFALHAEERGGSLAWRCATIDALPSNLPPRCR